MSFLFHIINSSSNTSSPAQPVQELPPNGVRVFLISGQSNSKGRAYSDNADPNDLGVKTNVKIWDKTGAPAWNNLEIVNGIGGNNNSTLDDEHGIEVGLAKYYNDYFPNETLYLIKYGVGNSPIQPWISGGVHFNKFWNLFLSPAVNRLLLDGKIPYLYFFWSQGESDASPALVNSFQGKFNAWFDLWRNNLHNELPIALAEVLMPGNPEFTSGNVIVNDIFQNKADTEQFIESMPTRGYTDRGDAIHYSADAYLLMAQDVLAYFKTQNGVAITQPISSTPPTAP